MHTSSCAHPFPNNGTAATIANTGASTTGTIYGIYDMVGGLSEMVMGNMTTTAGAFYPSLSGAFSPSPPDSKYYNSYMYDSFATCDGTTPANTGCKNHYRGKLGDATRETLSSFGTSYADGAWYSSASLFPAATASWFHRGGHVRNVANAGVFCLSYDTGGVNWIVGFRIVMSG